MKRLVLAGGGHAHLHVLERFARERPREVELVLVAPVARPIYSGMLPGWIAGRYRLDACALPLDRLAARAGAHFVRKACAGLDATARVLVCEDGERIAFDWLSLDVGAGSAATDLPGADRAVAVRPLERFVATIGQLLDDARAGRGVDTAIVGGGAAAIELALALAARFASLGRRDARVVLVAASARPLDGLPKLLQWRAQALLRSRGIGWIGGRRVVAIAERGPSLDDGSCVEADRVLLATGSVPHRWLAQARLACDDAGYVRVAPTLQSVSHPQVFAAGDCAALAVPRPRSGVFAVRAGPPLAANLLRALDGEPLRPWRPQARALYLVSTGAEGALAAWGAFACWGDWVGRWKDRIDRRFVARFGASPG